jgi:capsular polysaccharide biosynthesis protein
MAAMFVVAAISLVRLPVYQSTTIIMVNAANEGQSGPEYNSLLLNRQLVKTFSTLAVVRDSLMEIAAGVKSVSPSELADKINVAPVKDLELMKISVKDENPERADLIAQKTVEVLQNKTKLLYGSDTIKVISSTASSTKQDKPGIVLICTAAAGAVGFVIAVIIAFWLEDKFIRYKLLN